MLKITRRVGLRREREIKRDVVSKKGQVELTARRVKLIISCCDFLLFLFVFGFKSSSLIPHYVRD